MHTWTLRGKIDGLGADPQRNRLIVTVNEDADSSLYVLRPWARPGQQVVHYIYAPNPSSAATGGVLSGGGTDAVTVLPDGSIITSASNPETLKATAAFKVKLSPHGHIATLTPTFSDSSEATSALTGKEVRLGLTDPDSNAWVPFSSPRFGGQFVLDGQADQQLVFVKDIGHSSVFGPSSLTQLTLSHTAGTSTSPAGVDDVRWTQASGGALYVVDANGGTGDGSIYKITGPFKAGQVFAALDTIGTAAANTELDSLNLSTGLLSPFGTGFVTTKGIVWAAR